MYYTCKQAVEAITRSAFGLYKDKNVMSYGIAPSTYTTDMAKSGGEKFGLSMEQYWAGANPFPVEGHPEDIGNLTAAVASGPTVLESGITYAIFPIPPQYYDAEDPCGSGSIAYAVGLHGGDHDNLDGDAHRVALTKISKAYYSNGKEVPHEMLDRIRMGLVEARLAK
jgi:hypothetical protein